jgi:hypothetical protein
MHNASLPRTKRPFSLYFGRLVACRGAFSPIIGIFKRPFSGDFRSCTSALFCLEFRNENPIPRLIGYPNISDDPPSAVTPPARHFPHAKFTDEIERPTLGDLQFLGNQSC